MLWLTTGIPGVFGNIFSEKETVPSPYRKHTAFAHAWSLSVSLFFEGGIDHGVPNNIETGKDILVSKDSG